MHFVARVFCWSTFCCAPCSISKATPPPPPPPSTGKQLFYLHWSFPVTSVNRQPIKEMGDGGWGGVGGQTGPDPLMVSRSEGEFGPGVTFRVTYRSLMVTKLDFKHFWVEAVDFKCPPSSV